MPSINELAKAFEFNQGRMIATPENVPTWTPEMRAAYREQYMHAPSTVSFAPSLGLHPDEVDRLAAVEDMIVAEKVEFIINALPLRGLHFNRDDAELVESVVRAARA